MRDAREFWSKRFSYSEDGEIGKCLQKKEANQGWMRTMVTFKKN